MNRNDSKRRVRIIDHQTLKKVSSFLRLDQFTVRYPKFKSGQFSGPMDLVNVHRGGSVAGLLHITGSHQQCLLLVEQFRLPTIIKVSDGLPDMERISREEDAGRMLELMAGTRRGDEPWLEAFRRECKEETRLDPDFVEHIGSYYPSPGACSELIHLYYGRIDWPAERPWPTTDAPEASDFGDDKEDIRRHFIEPKSFFQMIIDGELQDGKCLVAAEWMRRPENAEKFVFPLAKDPEMGED